MSTESLRLTIEVKELTKRYLGAVVLDNVSLGIFPNEFIVINGPSGAGKTTLLNMMSGIDVPEEGSVRVGEKDITKLSRKKRQEFRACNGQIFQRSGLLNGLTAEENIHSVHDLVGNNIDTNWFDYLVSELSVGDVLKKPISQLSGGQAQRIGIIRALAHHPRLVFADEPTASLDSDSKRDVYDLLRKVASNDSTVVMVSHDEISKEYADGVFEMRDGVIDKFTPMTPEDV